MPEQSSVWSLFQSVAIKQVHNNSTCSYGTRVYPTIRTSNTSSRRSHTKKQKRTRGEDRLRPPETIAKALALAAQERSMDPTAKAPTPWGRGLFRFLFVSRDFSCLASKKGVLRFPPALSSSSSSSCCNSLYLSLSVYRSLSLSYLDPLVLREMCSATSRGAFRRVLEAPWLRMPGRAGA